MENDDTLWPPLTEGKAERRRRIEVCIYLKVREGELGVLKKI